MKEMLMILMTWIMVSITARGVIDFESGDLSDWTVRAQNSSDWSITTDTTDSGNKVLNFYNSSTGGDILYTASKFGDGAIEWNMYYNEGISAYNRIYIHAFDPGSGTEVQNGYYWRPDGCQLRRLNGGSVTTLATGSVVNYAGGWNKFKAEVTNSVISIYHWNSGGSTWDLIVSATDSTLSSGYFGFRGTADNGGATNYNHYDNIVLPEPPTVKESTIDFESGGLSHWTIRAEDDADWSIATDTTDSSNNVMNFYDNNVSGDILYTAESFGDSKIEWDMYYNKSLSGYNRVYLRATDPGTGKTAVENGYYWRPSSCQLRKLVNDNATTLATGTVVDYATHWTRFKAVAVGSTLTIYKWDAPNSEWDVIVSATDSTFSDGYFGFRSTADDGGDANYNHFDNVVLPALPGGTLIMIK